MKNIRMKMVLTMKKYCSTDCIKINLMNTTLKYEI